MTEAEADLEALKQAQPSWRADGLGVRGNPVEFQKQQAQIEWPSATFSRRAGQDLAGPATAGAPDHPDSVPAS